MSTFEKHPFHKIYSSYSALSFFDRCPCALECLLNYVEWNAPFCFFQNERPHKHLIDILRTLRFNVKLSSVHSILDK